jgi:serine phosphatase RsbU (regulator of sigma subunit)/anti-sigma regulatory factor (Ser/Thr protein kinase)/anti-anti-sigma regulatory factor
MCAKFTSSEVISAGVRGQTPEQDARGREGTEQRRETRDMAEENALSPGDSEALASALEQGPYIFIACEGPDLRIIGINAAGRAMIADRDVVGKPIREAFPDLLGQRWLELFDDVYRTGNPTGGKEWRVQFLLPGGSVKEVYANFALTPWRHPDGRIRGVIGMAADVTDGMRSRRVNLLARRREQGNELVSVLQSALLPTGLPVLPDVRIAASYLLADADTAAGGDWFDAVPLPGNSVALVVGDVVGHGVAASAVMGQLRTVLQDRLGGGATIADALAAVNRLAGRVEGARAATVCVAVLDPSDGTLTYCTAGHPPPLVVPPHGNAYYLTATGAAPLGTGLRFPTATARLGLGDLVLLYSDGIIERPGTAIASSTVELAQVAADVAAGRAFRTPEFPVVDQVCTQTLELLIRATGHTDDITLLAAQRVAGPAELRVRVAAEPGALRTTREELGGWLRRCGASDDDLFALQHAIGELVTNSVEHAFAGRPDAGTVAVTASLGPSGEVRATVSDDGRWREPDGQPEESVRGRGLAMSAQFVDRLTLRHGSHGTTATVDHRLSRPARLLTAGDVLPGSPASSTPHERGLLLILDQTRPNAPRVRLDGPVDASTAAYLQADLVRRTRGGTRPLLVDLTGVTHLASAGVAALHQAVALGFEQGAPLTLYAPAGSLTHHIMSMVTLPHTTLDPDG